MHVELDHLVVAARSLQEGADWCEATFGIAPGPGGQHPLMGTHNRLLRLGGTGFARSYLEIIAIDPQAAAPGRARWFGLDTPAVQQALAHGPQLLHWVARTGNLDMHRWGLVASGFDPGPSLAAERPTPAGLLRWRIVVPDDGRPRCGGALPTIIEWPDIHPTDHMPDSGLVLQSLQVRGLPAQAAEVLRPRGIELAAGEGPVLQAVFESPRGPVTLASPRLG